MSLSSIDLNLLLTLHALLEERSVSRAADRIGRSQSGTSHALGRLRQHFGDPLLVRDGWEMRLSQRGETLRAPVHEAVRRLETVFEGARTFDPMTSDRLFRVGAPDICIPLLTRLVGQMARDARGVKLELIELMRPSEAVRRGEVDLALGFGGGDAVEDGLRRQTLMSVNWAVFCRNGHSFAARPTLVVWAQASHIQVRTGDAGPVERAAAKAKLERQVSVFAPSFHAAITIAASSDLLFTTLREPFESVAVAMGLRCIPSPLDLPSSRMLLIAPPDYGDEGLSWLRDQIGRYVNEAAN